MPSAALLVFVAWCVLIVHDVRALRRDLEQRVHWMQTVRVVEESVRGGDDLATRRLAVSELDAALPAMMAASREDPQLRVALDTAMEELPALEQSASPRRPPTDGVSSIVPALRRQTAGISAELGGYFDALYVLALLSIIFAASTLALHIRSRTHGARREASDAAHLHASLLRADRLAALGTLAATVAHEINNPLGFVLSNLEVMEDQLAGAPNADDEMVTSLEQAKEGVRRVATIVRDLRSIAHPGRAQEHQRIDVHAPLQASIRICQGEARARTRLVTVFGRNVPRVYADEAQLGQVFLNLLVNAIQAIEPGRPNDNEITIRTAEVLQAVRVDIFDTGPGIDPREADRIFEPFVTTKAVGEGTGLGLYVCRSLVESMHGRIELAPRDEGGTRATIILPVAPSTDMLSERSVSIHEPTPTEDLQLRILIVDDEEMLASALARSLRGHHVQTANRGAAALQMARAGHFDLVLCDLIMPEMSGKEVYEALAQHDPTIRTRFVFMTGATVTSEARAFAAQVDAPVLEKPFSRAQLLAVLERFL